MVDIEKLRKDGMEIESLKNSAKTYSNIRETLQNYRINRAYNPFD